MTIAATPRRSPVYTGNGVATTYAFSFKVLDATTLVVTVADENDLNSAVLVNGVDYTVTLNADQDASPGGEIGYAGLPVGHRLVITSAVDASQPTAIANLGAFHADVIEAALDRIVIQHQQQQEQLDRCVKVVATSEQDPTTLLDNAVTSAANSASAAAASALAADASADVAAAAAMVADALLALQAGGSGGVLTVDDRGGARLLSAGVTVPASVFAARDVVVLYNNTAGDLTITEGASLTLRFAGSAAVGNRTLAQRGLATVVFISPTEAVISGAGVS